MAIIQIDDVTCRKDRRELLLQKFPVFGAHTETCHRTDVAEYRIFDALIELFDELMGNIERKAILPSFRENDRDGVGRHILEFVDVEVKRRRILRECIDAREGCHENLTYDDKPQEMRVDIPKTSFGKINEKDLSGVHDLSEIKRGFFLRDDGTHDVV